MLQKVYVWTELLCVCLKSSGNGSSFGGTPGD